VIQILLEFRTLGGRERGFDRLKDEGEQPLQSMQGVIWHGLGIYDRVHLLQSVGVGTKECGHCVVAFALGAHFWLVQLPRPLGTTLNTEHVGQLEKLIGGADGWTKAHLAAIEFEGLVERVELFEANTTLVLEIFEPITGLHEEEHVGPPALTLRLGPVHEEQGIVEQVDRRVRTDALLRQPRGFPELHESLRHVVHALELHKPVEALLL